MKSSSTVTRLSAWITLACVSVLGAASASWAYDGGTQSVRFQKPRQAVENQRLTFRSASQAAEEPAVASDTEDLSGVVLADARDAKPKTVTPPKAGKNPLRAQPLPKPVKKTARAKQTKATDTTSAQHIAKKATTGRSVRPDRQVAAASHGQVIYESEFQQTCATCGMPEPMCGCAEPMCGCAEPMCGCAEPMCGCAEPMCGCAEPMCGCAEPMCGVAEPMCGCAEPMCGCAEPMCGCAEPMCGCAEPDCGYAEPMCGCAEPMCGVAEPGCGMIDGCGDCVAPPTPDYWCFPVCLPRFKTLTVWGGVHGFRGPRDFSLGPNQVNRSDSNFGFQEGINIGGRAPFVGLLFPQLSYQLGYQAVQSRLHGTATDTIDRSQQFVTAGLFRRVPHGLQFGVVWDMMEDDLDVNADFHQIRTEISIKSALGREIGFIGMMHTNDNVIGGVTYEAVDQYLLFYRWYFRRGGQGRFWGGFTNDSDGIFGGDFHFPLSDSWALQTGFNYLITDQPDGLPGVSEESWNIGINLVWHLGRRARQPAFQPLFNIADNGWMFIDQKP